MARINVFPIIIASALLAAIGCTGNSKTNTPGETNGKDSSLGNIEYFDAEASSLLDSNATIEVIGSGYTWSEGPVWLEKEKALLFSDVPENKIYRWTAASGTNLYLTPSGYTDTAFRDGENGANGLALDTAGRLLLCQSGDRKIARLDASLENPRPSFVILSPGYNGKKFNSPNDLVADSHNNIYFTDPTYGLPKGDADPTRELKFEGVYKISAAGQTTLLIDSIPKPNGIALSPDEHILYVASSDAEHPGWFAYQLDEYGNIKSGGILLDATEMKNNAKVKQGADGFKLDAKGNIYSAGPEGINIISPGGKLLARINIYNRSTSNCAFNKNKDILFITADDLVLKVSLHK